MNISTIYNNVSQYFNPNFISGMTAQQKKTTAIAIGVFSLFSLACYCVYSFKASKFHPDKL